MVDEDYIKTLIGGTKEINKELKKIERFSEILNEYLAYLLDYARKHKIPPPKHIAYFNAELENAWDYPPPRMQHHDRTPEDATVPPPAKYI